MNFRSRLWVVVMVVTTRISWKLEVHLYTA